MTVAASTVTNLTLLDRVKRSKPDGSIDTQIIEILTKRNALLKEMVWKEGNLPTGHRMTSRRALPSVDYRQFNKSVATSKSRTDQFDEACGRIETWAETDQALADLGGNAADVRISEEMAFMQAMNNEVETGMISNSTKTSPEKWMGLAPRFSATTDTAGGQIVLWGGSSSGNDQSSMWLVGHGDRTVFGIYPKGSSGGLVRKDWGERPVKDSSGYMAAYVTEMHWSLGLCVADWRYVSRLANIDTSAVSATGVDIITGMVLADHQIFEKSSVRLAWYCNRKIGAYLHLQSLTKAIYQIKQEQVAGEYVTTFLGVPVRETDAITNSESVIS